MERRHLFQLTAVLGFGFLVELREKHKSVLFEWKLGATHYIVTHCVKAIEVSNLFYNKG